MKRGDCDWDVDMRGGGVLVSDRRRPTCVEVAAAASSLSDKRAHRSSSRQARWRDSLAFGRRCAPTSATSRRLAAASHFNSAKIERAARRWYCPITGSLAAFDQLIADHTGEGDRFSHQLCRSMLDLTPVYNYDFNTCILLNVFLKCSNMLSRYYF